MPRSTPISPGGPATTTVSRAIRTCSRRSPRRSVNGSQPNSSFRTESASAGGSWLFDGGYAGVAVTRFATDYHIPGLEGAATRTHIRLEQSKIISKGEFRPMSSAVAAVRYWAGFTDYKHDEIGLNDIGFEQINGSFLNREKEGKVEIELMPMATPFGAWTSFFGAQGSHQQLDTSGEALLFPARTRVAAAYWFNEIAHTPFLRSQFATRVDNVKVDGTAVEFPANFMPPPDDPPASARSVSFAPKSVSYSLFRDLPSFMVASINLQRIERAPRAIELFSKGPHDATQTFDIGNPNLTIETANTAEIGLKRVLGDFRFDGKAYYTRYNNFIYQQPTGKFCDDTFATCGTTGTEFIQTVISQRDAIFRGAELAWHWDVLPLGPGIFGLDGQYDTVRATFTDGSNVPRMPPQRVGGGAYWRNDNWFVRAGLLHAWAQYDLAPFETPTAGYNLVKAEITHKRFWRDSPWGPVEITTGLVGDNLLNVQMRNSTQFHKDEVLLPGRSFKFFLNAKFDAERPSGPPGYDKARNGSNAPISKNGMVYKAPIMAAWNWSGFYAGGNAGWSSGRTITINNFYDPTLAPLFGTESSNRLDGAIYGTQAGYNWMPNHMLVGIEGDVQLSHQRAGVAALCTGNVCNAPLAPLNAPVTLAFDHKLPWFGTLRGRLGAPVTPDLLAYATVGIAFGEVKTSGTISGFDAGGNALNAAFSHTAPKGGWTIGAGLEAHLAGNWTGQGRISLHGLRLARGYAGAADRDDHRGHGQSASHRQHRADRRELQIRSERSDVRQVLIAPVAVWRRRSGCNARPHDRPHALLDDDVT